MWFTQRRGGGGWRRSSVAMNPPILGVALKEDHRPAGPRQLGGGDQPVDATPDDDRISFVRHLVDSSQGE